MARKRWEAKTEITPELVQAREKRKWQINLRRYVIEKSPCPSYAPYFGLDITSMRKWFEQQFTGELTWNNFGDQWQFTHIMPLYLFDHENDDDLRLCWNFINLRVEPTFPAKPAENRLSLLAAKVYFEGIVKTSDYWVAKEMLKRLIQIEEQELKGASPQLAFLAQTKEYLGELRDYAAFEFELLNGGRNIADINKELALLRKNV